MDVLLTVFYFSDLKQCEPDINVNHFKITT